MPLIGSECKLLSREEFETLHQLSNKDELSITLGTLIDEETQNHFCFRQETIRGTYRYFWQYWIRKVEHIGKDVYRVI